MARTGLVLEGGAMRGMFTAGITDVYMEQGIDFDGMIGVSAGAAFGCNYKSRQIGRVIRYNKRFCRNWHFAGIRSWLITGDLYGADFDYRKLPAELDPWDTKTFQENPMAFWCVCTDADTGEAVYHRCEDGGERDLLYIRASASMPVASRPVQVDGRRLLDGGIADSIPLRFFEDQGYDRNVVILTQPADYKKQPMAHAALLHRFLTAYPAVEAKLRTRHIDYNRQTAYARMEEELGRALVICPDTPLRIGSVCHDPQELERVYQIGRKKGEETAARVRQFLAG
ncbi:MAG: patatin family protein [Lachnospiraceae bacterium]|nr:patatin family protein [Lachnospiraceae bacterium]MCI1423549.1 patatin family protein [Lachnospiraceae bacterium]MDD5850403.1 patatin family protein [Bacillota bacterium]